MRPSLRLVLFSGFLSWALAATADPLVDAIQATDSGDHRKAVQLLTPLANAGHPLAQNRLGLLYYHGRGVTEDERQAVAWWKKSAGQGNADAMFQLANAFLLGSQAAKLVADPDREAATWFFKAASTGHVEAQYMLGHLFLAGKGVMENRREAANWFRKAASQNHVEARRALDSLDAKR